MNKVEAMYRYFLEQTEFIHQRPVFYLGFRIFFLSATLSSIFAMLWWLLAYVFHWSLPTANLLLPQYWHGHEMVFGYSVALVAGFLLTAVQNWTSVPMPKLGQLFVVWIPWIAARFTFVFGWGFLGVIADLIFITFVAYAVINACRQAEGQLKRQAGIIAKLVLLVLTNVLLLCAIFLKKIFLIRLALYAGVFLIIGLVLTIGRRVMPFFTRNGVLNIGYQFEPKNSDKLDKNCLRYFLIFFFAQLIVDCLVKNNASKFIVIPLTYTAAISAIITAILNLKRLSGWYCHGIWRVPLLWSMHLSFFIMIIGFLLYGVLPFSKSINESLAMHAFAVGGIGLMGLLMIGRVSLGHTGRNIMIISKQLHIGLYLMAFSVLFRVIFPVLMPSKFMVWIIHAQITWIIAFILLFQFYLNIWLTPRADGKFG